MKWPIISLILLLIVPGAFGGVFLHEYMYEGETKILPANGGYYEIRLVTVSDFTEKAIFSVNGELSKALTERETDVLKDGSRITPTMPFMLRTKTVPSVGIVLPQMLSQMDLSMILQGSSPIKGTSATIAGLTFADATLSKVRKQ